MSKKQNQPQLTGTTRKDLDTASRTVTLTISYATWHQIETRRIAIYRGLVPWATFAADLLTAASEEDYTTWRTHR